MDNGKFIPSDKHIFTQKKLEEIDIEVMYTSMIANDKSFFVFGGYDSKPYTPSAEVRRYDISDQKWHKMKEMPHYLWGSTAQIIGDDVFIMGGGRHSTYTCYNLVYNIPSDSWSEKADLPISRKGLVSGIIDGIIYIACGYQMWSIYNIATYCYAYNPKTDTWKECKRPLRPRSFAMSVVVDKYLYVLGGYTDRESRGECRKMDRYCPETDKWEAMPDMPRPRNDAVAVAIDSKIFVLCGYTGTDYNCYMTMDYYDTRTKKWTISDIPTPQLRSPGVAMIDNKIYLTGGFRLSTYNRNLYEITYGGMKE